jgi:hypothetical protein
MNQRFFYSFAGSKEIITVMANDEDEVVSNVATRVMATVRYHGNRMVMNSAFNSSTVKARAGMSGNQPVR